MKVRKFVNGDEQELWELFYNTIHTINIHDYNQTQIDSWAPKELDISIAIKKFREINPFVVTKEEKIIAYADIQPDGYIDHFYCHHKFQRQGVGKLLFSVLKKEAEKNDISQMYSNVSITAKPFFEAMGFLVEKEQLLQVKNQELKNFRMICRI